MQSTARGPEGASARLRRGGAGTEYRVGETTTPLFAIERNFAEELHLTEDTARLIGEVNRDVGVHWLFSFLSADKEKTYCLYEAPSASVRRRAARGCPSM